jgi:thioredoxin-dependent peroxiredoxin
MEKITLKGQPIEVMGSMPAVGSHAPALMGIDGEWKEHSLKDFKGKKKIICFVPSLDTSVCSTSAQKFNQKIQSKKNTAVIYCSMDLPFVFKRTCEHLSHVTPLSLFRTPQVAEAFGARQSSGPLKGLCARAVFVLDESDKVLYHQLVKEITTEPDYDKALTYLS